MSISEKKAAIKEVIEQRDSRAGMVFSIGVQVLIIVSLISFSLDTLPDLSQRVMLLLQVVEVVTVLLFSVEYALRLYVADNKWQFAKSFYGIIDLLAILPFYLGLIFTTLGIDFRAIRIFRLLRLFRTFKLVRYSKAIRLFGKAFAIAREELVLFLVATLMLFYFASVGIWYFESEAQPEAFSSVFSSLWWAVVTLTTVGYGDIYPITVGGRIFTFCLLLIGLGTIAVPSGIVASALNKARAEIDSE
ncbi:MAG: ion transporter [Gammaproteobacteria bacterium]|nr:ion transporter [Gammaproteobacteria bacterium]MDH4313324.1 ion transporter [Gammaproteobacteria bacterium]MDH5214695.1 ion transporter [Gammaproteobacteria bacterium]MDH5499895.1 ion transporter [Gammaproteobacteria bacterium]